MILDIQDYTLKMMKTLNYDKYNILRCENREQDCQHLEAPLQGGSSGLETL